MSSGRALTPAGKHERVAFCMVLVGLLVAASIANGQVRHPYPRTAIFHFGNAVADWYSRFDLVMTPNRSPSFAQRIKQLSPDTIVLPTSGWTAWISRDRARFPSPTEKYWLAVDSKGKVVSTEWGAQLIDLTNYSPKYNGKRYNEAFPEFILSMTDLNAFDGVASDWLWSKPHNISDIDFDRNGKNDYVEHGKEWVERVWREGVETLLTNLRNQMPADKLILCNSGLFHSYGWETTNGLIMEHTSGIYSWEYFWRRYREWMAKARRPHVFIMDGRPDSSDPNLPKEGKNYFRLMRFLLTATLLGDGYFTFTDPGAGEHHYNRYYDEFDVQLGYPISDAAELENGCWVRFFDRGVAITNPTGQPQTVSDADLQTLSGYQGPYYRFRGGQDPDVNNGKQFEQVRLWGAEDNSKILGDGIILVNEPEVVVSDIIIDNLDYGTSPANQPVRLVGDWQQTDAGREGYYIINRARNGWYPHAYTTGGNGGSTAAFVPSITVPGRYEVFEWHGYIRQDEMATNVPVTITYAGGRKKEMVIDQSSRYGQWNSLGVYEFAAGHQGTVEISNRANGIVVADAVKFVYLGSGSQTGDTNPPSPPKGVRVKN